MPISPHNHNVIENWKLKNKLKVCPPARSTVPFHLIFDTISAVHFLDLNFIHPPGEMTFIKPESEKEKLLFCPRQDVPAKTN